jgi:hypothetical protein
MNWNKEFDDAAVERVRADVAYICDEIPSRLAGSEAGKRMAHFSAAGLRKAGLDPVVHEIPGLVSFPQRCQLKLLTPTPETLECNTLGHSTQTPPEGITAALIDCGAGGYGDYAGKELKGKIALVELSYHPGRHEKQRIAAELGAIGCVMMNWGPPDSTWIPYGSVKPAWGNPTPESFRNEMAVLPCVGLSRADGLKLRTRLCAEQVTVNLHTNVENGWRPVHVTTADLKADGSDDFVVIGGHQDSWEGPQATDNAAGNACMLELARFFTRHQDKLRRGVTFGFWTGHETGTMVGSTWYVDNQWERLRRHAVGYLQIDQPACAGTTRWGSVSNSELRAMMGQVDASLLGDIPCAWRRTVKVGDASFFGIGVPMFAGQGVFTSEELKVSANASLGWWHHTTENTIDKIEWPAMALHLRMYAAYVWRLCTDPVIPCEFTAVADDVIARLGELQKGASFPGLDRAMQKTLQLKTGATELAEACARVTRGCEQGDALAEEHACELNQAIKKLSRLLLPMCGTVKGTYGHDPYAYTPQTTMLPSLYEVPQLAGMPQSEPRWLLETKLVREVNRVCDTLDDASDVIRLVLKAQQA